MRNNLKTCCRLLMVTLLVTACAGAPEPGLPVPPVTSPTGGVNAPEQVDKPYVVLVSIDGFRWDYPDQGLTPTLGRLAREGVRAERLLPAFPTLTFPNHYTLVTGLYPAHHGLVGNDFPTGGEPPWYHYKDRALVGMGELYGGEPLWVTAEKQGMVSASYFWVGSEADIAGVRPTHWRYFSKQASGTQRVDQVLTWLAEPPSTRPHFYTLYFEEVDDYNHWYGPGSAEGNEAIRRVDRYLQRLINGLERLPHGKEVNVVVVSDHGQGRYLEPEKPLVLDSFIDLEGVTVVDSGCLSMLYFDAPDPARAAQIRDRINQRWDHGTAFTPAEAPAAWGLQDFRRPADVIVSADAGYAVISTLERKDKINKGDHGWRPESPDMHGIFIARGPAFRQGLRIGPVRNVDIQPLVLELLGLEAPGEVDGDLNTLREILR